MASGGLSAFAGTENIFFVLTLGHSARSVTQRRIHSLVRFPGNPSDTSRQRLWYKPSGVSVPGAASGDAKNKGTFRNEKMRKRTPARDTRKFVKTNWPLTARTEPVLFASAELVWPWASETAKVNGGSTSASRILPKRTPRQAPALPCRATARKSLTNEAEEWDCRTDRRLSLLQQACFGRSPAIHCRAATAAEACARGLSVARAGIGGQERESREKPHHTRRRCLPTRPAARAEKSRPHR